VIHAHSWAGGLAAIAGADGMDVPVAQTFHTLEQPPAARPGARAGDPRTRLVRALGRRADAVIASCADEESELIRLGVPRRNIAVIPGGVDIERFKRQGPAMPRGSRPRLVHVGGLAPDGGVATAIRALAAVPDAELLVAGGPAAGDLVGNPMVERLTRLAKEAGAEDRVTFLGHVQHGSMPKLIRSADLVLTLPGSVPTGMVALEAMACGVPVIASAVGAHLDAVLDGVTGVLVPVRHPARTARMARELLADPTRRAALGYAGADRVRSRYSYERISHELLRVYEEALETSGSHRLAAAH
jgi:glycosyltransferase involved in cell wall biosynthesis